MRFVYGVHLLRAIVVGWFLRLDKSPATGLGQAVVPGLRHGWLFVATFGLVWV